MKRIELTVSRVIPATPAEVFDVWHEEGWKFVASAIADRFAAPRRAQG